jgi:hypothetical protein
MASLLASDPIKAFCNSNQKIGPSREDLTGPQVEALKYYVAHGTIPVRKKLQVYAGFGLRISAANLHRDFYSNLSKAR